MTDKQEEFWDLIKDQSICMVVTEDDGNLRSRPMAARVDREGKMIRFLTRRTDAKVEELHHDRDVNISYADPDDQIYASVSGRAQVTTDRALIKELWDPFCDVWFQGSADDADVAVIEVKPVMAEYWKNDSGMIGTAYEFAKAYFSDTEPDIGENKKLHLAT